MSRRVYVSKSKKEVAPTGCHMCAKSGQSLQIVESHNFRDVKGRVCCPNFIKKLRDNICYKCNGSGHFADRCTVILVTKLSDKLAVNPLTEFPELSQVKVKTGAKPAVSSSNVWDSLTRESSSDEEEYAKIAPNVTLRAKPKIKATKIDWAAESDDDEDVGKKAPWAK